MKKKSIYIAFFVALFFATDKFSFPSLLTYNIYNNNFKSSDFYLSYETQQSYDIEDLIVESTAIVLVKVYTDDMKDVKEIRLGTGFFIGYKEEGILVTAFNLVVNSNQIIISYGYKKGEVVNIDYPRNITQIYPIKTQKKYYWPFQEKNIIIFKIPKQLKSAPLNTLNFSYDKVDIGDKVLTCGHPNNKCCYRISKSIVSSFLAIENTTYIATKFLDITLGYIGSPVVNENGQLIGIINKFYNNDYSIQLSTPVLYIKHLYSEVKGGYGIADFDMDLKNYSYPDSNAMYYTIDVDKYSNLFPELSEENN